MAALKKRFYGEVFMTAETIRTKTNIEAWIDYFSGYGVAAAGSALAFKYASWLPDSIAIPFAQAIDKFPLPKCPDFKPEKQG